MAGYISKEDDLEKLKDSSFTKKMAKTVYDAVMEIY